MIQSISMSSSSGFNVSTSDVTQKYAAQKSVQENDNTAAMSAMAGTAAKGTPPAQPAAENVTESSQGDTLELSSQGVAQAKTAVQQAAASVVKDSKSSDLAQYSEAQLKEMVKEGTITRAEMDAELAARAEKEKEDSSDSSSDEDSDTVSVQAVTTSATSSDAAAVDSLTKAMENLQ